MKFRVQISLLLIPLLLAGFGLGKGSEPDCAERPVERGAYAKHISQSDDEITVVSLNMAKEAETGAILQDLRQAKFFGEADVWLMQEAMPNVPEIARELELDYIYTKADDAQGLAILSRYPIGEAERVGLPQFNLKFHTRCRIALSAEIEDTQIVNVHLDTRITEEQRLEQVARLLDETGGKRIIGGDFNTANVRWVGNVLPIPFLQDHAKAMQEMFISRGFESPLGGSGSTFKMLGLPLHLDWIFAKELKPMDAGVEEIEFSDHNAVWVKVHDAE